MRCLFRDLQLLSGLLAGLILLTACPSLLAQQGEDLVALEEQAMRAAVERVAPSVLRIETVGGKEVVDKVLIGTGPTTGLVVAEDGYMVSSAFNFVQEPSSILVTLPSGARAPAQIVARDNSRMLVLLKIASDEKLPVPEVAPADSIQVGQWAVAVGRTFAAERPNMSVGIVSALDRIHGRAIQTDAKISPNNYGGPLVDIQGRVLGVLVPMSPQGGSEVAGVQWYDGGIGFAVPMTTVMQRLADLRGGKNLEPGVLGVSLGSGDPYAEPAKIASALPNSPAYEAGIRSGDTVVEINGVPVTSQMQMKIQLGRYYAGDELNLVVLRGEERLPHQVELVEKLPPFEHAFLGILPHREMASDEDAPAGIAVRYVYPDSPAAQAGISSGDRITKIAGKEVKTPAEARAALSSTIAGHTVEVEYTRSGEQQTVELTAASLPTALPGELPAARDKLPAAEGERPAVGVSEGKLPEFKNAYQLYVPENYHPDVRYGVVVWLHGPGGDEEKQVLEQWKPLCKLHDLILVIPGSNAPNQWERTEAEFIARVLAQVTKTYSTDPARTVLHGYQAGGAMAYLVGLRARDLVGAVAVVDAPLPANLELPSSDPIRRTAVFTTKSAQSRFADRISHGIESLQREKYPVTVMDLGGEVRYLKPEELVDLARWIDTLDRF